MKITELYKKIKENLGKYAFKYFIAAGIEQLVIVICLNVVIAFAVQYAVTAAAKNNIDYLYYAIGILGVALLVAFLIIPIAGYLSNKYMKEAITEIKLRFYQHVIYLKKEESSKFHAGNLMSLFTDDIKQIEDLYSVKIKEFLSVCFIGPISIGALLSLNWIMGLIVLFFGIISILFTTFCAKKNKIISGKLQNAKSESSSKLMDLLNGLEDTKILGISNLLHKNYSEECNKVKGLTKKQGGLEAIIVLFSGFMYYFKEIVVLAAGIMLMRRGILSIGEIIASAYLLVNAGYMFDNIGIFYANVQKSLVSVERLEMFWNAERENFGEDSEEQSICMETAYGDKIIQFDHVHFGYKEKKNILNDVNFEIAEGDYVAIVGPSGSGKSTIIKLLLGFYGNDSGDILIKGRGIQEYSVWQLRNMTSYVPQEPYLFPGTIKENIQYGNWTADMEQIIQASKDALCHEFISELPEGYDTAVGNGTSLSGGQIQRIAIARALLKKAHIMLLDEPTAALDAESEKQVLETLDKLKNRITIIVITHKIYTISRCDKVFALDNGQIFLSEPKYQGSL
ncbi:ABC transporter ATP-binding protein [Anaerocolumna xylanovorans]|uniref:ATP-binding cassette, subfamily B n=1 Tax=Anaerocolumna xylanovorans DSM 12503 TaxID=1121345 RepID=A0A1M7YMQ4_9FIRM|nr:ABC transporter ATP-binding protein [Anaerocolumna xylanovorans]SHO53816.1 ATP-binding cassette, subfamily B [Anaerocolumna xylanovorans DSM 12503]